MEKELILIDSGGKITYEVKLNEQDYERAQTDKEFLKSIYEKCSQDENATETTMPNISPETITTNPEIPPRKLWSHEASVAFLESMHKHYRDLSDPKRRKFVFEHVSNELNALGHDVTPITCLNKWKTVLRTHRHYKESVKLGKNPTKGPFVDEVESILETQQNPAELTSTKVEVHSSGESDTADLAEMEYDNNVSSNGRFVWTLHATSALLKSMAKHYKKMNSPKYRRKVFALIANELKMYKVTALMCQFKWKNLLRSYRNCRENGGNTTSRRFFYFKDMEKILGGNPHNETTNTTVNGISNISSSKNESAFEDVDEVMEQEQAMIGMDDYDCDVKDVNFKISPGHQQQQLAFEEVPDGSKLNELIALKKKEYERKQKRHEKRMELEKRKINVLEQILTNLTRATASICDDK